MWHSETGYKNHHFRKKITFNKGYDPRGEMGLVSFA
jgi:hypothetical protein